MVLLIAALALAANPPAASGVPALMPVYGVTPDSRGVTVEMQPAGCNTVKSDFTVAISRAVERPTILFTRRSASSSLEACKAQPHTVALTWSYDDLGLKPGQPFSLAN